MSRTQSSTLIPPLPVNTLTPFNCCATSSVGAATGSNPASCRGDRPPVDMLGVLWRKGLSHGDPIGVTPTGQNCVLSVFN